MTPTRTKKSPTPQRNPARTEPDREADFAILSHKAHPFGCAFFAGEKSVAAVVRRLSLRPLASVFRPLHGREPNRTVSSIYPRSPQTADVNGDNLVRYNPCMAKLWISQSSRHVPDLLQYIHRCPQMLSYSCPLYAECDHDTDVANGRAPNVWKGVSAETAKPNVDQTYYLDPSKRCEHDQASGCRLDKKDFPGSQHAASFHERSRAKPASTNPSPDFPWYASRKPQPSPDMILAPIEEEIRSVVDWALGPLPNSCRPYFGVKHTGLISPTTSGVTTAATMKCPNIPIPHPPFAFPLTPILNAAI
jgi:hypothetical protein